MSWLEQKTNKDEAYWVSRIQSLIGQHTVPKEDGHGETDTQWVHTLVEEVINNLPSSQQAYDGNMRIAATLGLVFSLWYSQVHNAKTFDSHRPTYERQQAYLGRQEWLQELFRIITDTHNGPTYFPGQPWQFPFDPEAKGGSFL